MYYMYSVHVWTVNFYRQIFLYYNLYMSNFLTL